MNGTNCNAFVPRTILNRSRACSSQPRSGLQEHPQLTFSQLHDQYQIIMNTVKIMQRLRPTTCSYRVVLIQPAGPALKRWQSNKIDPNEIGPKKLRPIQGWHTTLRFEILPNVQHLQWDNSRHMNPDHIFLIVCWWLAVWLDTRSWWGEYMKDMHIIVFRARGLKLATFIHIYLKIANAQIQGRY